MEGYPHSTRHARCGVEESAHAQSVEVFGQFSTLARRWLGEATRVELAALCLLVLEANNRTHAARRSTRWIAEQLGCHEETARRALAAWVRRGVLDRRDRSATSTPVWRLVFDRVARPVVCRRRSPRPRGDQLDSPEIQNTARAVGHGGVRGRSGVVRDQRGRGLSGTREARPGPSPEALRRARELVRAGVPPREACRRVADELRDDRVGALVAAGVARRAAWRLAARHTADRVRAVVVAARRAGPHNPGGWVVAALRGGWAV